MPYSKYAIIGSARTGTTMLACICDFHPNLNKCHFEPSKEMKTDDIKTMIKSLYQSGNGVKELISLNQKSNQIRNIIFNLPIKVIFTERKNILRQAISYCLALKLQIWQNEESNNHYLKKVSNIGDLPLKCINSYIKGTIKVNEVVKSELKDKPYFHLIYEDFFFGSRQFQIETMSEMFDFIGVKPCVNDHMINVIDHGRLNNEDVYRHIRNIDEIDRKFSKYGQIFDRLCFDAR